MDDYNKYLELKVQSLALMRKDESGYYFGFPQFYEYTGAKLADGKTYLNQQSLQSRRDKFIDVVRESQEQIAQLTQQMKDA